MNVGVPPVSASDAAANTPGAPRKNLVQAAHEFESMLISSLWQMAKSGLGDDSESDAAGDNIQDLGVRSPCAGISNAGGIGLADVLIHSLRNSEENKILTSNDKASQAHGRYMKEVKSFVAEL